MSIQPPSDIVLDVAQAADPAKSMAAAQRLMRAGPPEDANAGFSTVLEKVSVPLDNNANLRTQLELMGNHSPFGRTATEDTRTKAYKGLEALVFQNLFETTLPHDESLGSGMAGNVWRSMMAEQLGKQAAKMIDLGLFPKTDAAHAHQPGQEALRKSPSDASQAPSQTDPVGSSS